MTTRVRAYTCQCQDKFNCPTHVGYAPCNRYVETDTPATGSLTVRLCFECACANRMESERRAA